MQSLTQTCAAQCHHIKSTESVQLQLATTHRKNDLSCISDATAFPRALPTRKCQAFLPIVRSAFGAFCKHEGKVCHDRTRNCVRAYHPSTNKTLETDPRRFFQNSFVHFSLAIASAKDPGSMSVSKSNTSENASQLKQNDVAPREAEGNIVSGYIRDQLSDRFEIYVRLTQRKTSHERSLLRLFLQNHSTTLSCKSIRAQHTSRTADLCVTKRKCDLCRQAMNMDRPEKSIEQHSPPSHGLDALKSQSPGRETFSIQIVAGSVRMDWTLKKTDPWNL